MKEAYSLDELKGARYQKYVERTHARLTGHEGEHGDKHLFRSLAIHTLWGITAEGVILTISHYSSKIIDVIKHFYQ